MFPDLERIKKHNPLLIGEKEALKAAVCIALIENGDDYDVLFEVRSSASPASREKYVSLAALWKKGKHMKRQLFARPARNC